MVQCNVGVTIERGSSVIAKSKKKRINQKKPHASRQGLHQHLGILGGDFRPKKGIFGFSHCSSAKTRQNLLDTALKFRRPLITQQYWLQPDVNRPNRKDSLLPLNVSPP